MRKHIFLLSVLVIVSLILAACAADEGEPMGDVVGTPGFEETALPEMQVTPTAGLAPEEVNATPAAELGSTPEVAATETPQAAAPGAAGTPQASRPGGEQVRGAEIIPATGRAEAAQLSNLLGYSVVDQNDVNIGTAQDFILNVCEAHLLYIVVDVDPALGVQDGNLALIPYESITLSEGTIDTDQRVIVVNVNSAELADVPATPELLDLTTVDWENDVQTYWSGFGPLTLTTDCRVAAPQFDQTPEAGAGQTGTPESSVAVTPAAGSGTISVNKIAYASEILGAEFIDGNGNALGAVEDAILVPESGLVRYLVVSLDAGSGMVLVPMRAVNVFIEGEADFTATTFVLLVEPEVLQGAPTVTDLNTVAEESWDDRTFGYWSQHVPLLDQEEEQQQP